MHSHEHWTAVVVIMSGAATFITPGTASANSQPKETPDGGQVIGGGESHRVSKGDGPFRYLVVQTP